MGLRPVDYYKYLMVSAHGPFEEVMVDSVPDSPIKGIDMRSLARYIVHHRLLIQRGISFVAIFVASLTVVGVWRSTLPMIHWSWLLAVGMATYLACAWTIGWADEKWLWRIETSKYSQRNPELMEILERVKRIEEKLP